MRARSWLVVPVVVLVYASGVVASGPAVAAPMCFGDSATIAGTPGADILRGTPGADVIVGGGGNDTIRGLGGDDRICGGAGADVLAGGSGGDWVDGGAQEDSVRGGPSDFRVEHHTLVGNDNLFGGPGDDTIWSGRGLFDLLYGEIGNDTLTGAPSDQLLSGGPGNDVLSGSTGQDELWGGPGDDHLGGAGGRFDLALYFTNRGRLSVNLATQHADGEGRDSLSGVEGVFGLGGADERLVGDRRRNFLLSGEGDDQVQARAGSDFVETFGGADGTGSDGVFIKDHVQGNDAANGGPGKDFCIHDAHDALRSCVSGLPQPVPAAVRKALMVATAARAEQRA